MFLCLKYSLGVFWSKIQPHRQSNNALPFSTNERILNCRFSCLLHRIVDVNESVLVLQHVVSARDNGATSNLGRAIFSNALTAGTVCPSALFVLLGMVKLQISVIVLQFESVHRGEERGE